MKTPLAALLAVLVVASGCGEDDSGDDQPGNNPTGEACLLRIRGAVTEDLSCVVTAIDSSAGNPLSTYWEFEVLAYRGTTEIGATANFVHEGRPSLDTVYGWTASASNVFTGVAERTIPDPTGDPGAHVDTHQALYALGATGTLAATFTRIPPADATGAGLLDVHGTLEATLPAVDGVSAPVTFSAAF